MLVANVRKSGLIHTRINISSAALHLAYLLKGNIYLPSKTSQIEEFITSSCGNSDDREKMDHIRFVFGSSTQGCSTTMHRTLFLALAVSPVMLLLPRSFDQFAGKSALLDSWVQFGSISRPPWMIAADDAMWNVLLTATPGGDVITHVKNALTTLQPVLGSSTPPWFTLVSTKATLTDSVPSTSRVDDVDSDSNKGSANTAPGMSFLPPQSHLPGLTLIPSPCGDTDRATLNNAPSDCGLPSHPASAPAPAFIVDTPPVVPLPVVLSIPLPPSTLPDISLSDNSIKEGNIEASLDPAPMPCPPESIQRRSNNATDFEREENSDERASESSDIPSCPTPIDEIPKIIDNQPVLRRSARGNPNKPEAPYPPSTGNPRKRKKSGKPDVKDKDVAAPVLIKVQRNPDFIDLTLEDSDNEVQDMDLDLDNSIGFTFGNAEVSYPVNRQSPVFTWLPKFHLAADLKWYYELHDAACCSAKHERPSPVVTLTHDEYRAAKPAQLLDMFRTKACIPCIHVVGQSDADPGFKEEVFSEICNVDEITTLHDFTVEKGPRTRRGTIMDLLSAATLDSPKAVSALHMPAPYDLYPRLPFSSDWFVWVKVQGKAYCRASELYPVPDMRWAIASTGSAHHFWHVDANRLGTFLRVETGVKLWFIAVPKHGDFRLFMRPDVMTSFELDESNEDLWDVYVIVLSAGDFLIMCPGLPHCSELTAIPSGKTKSPHVPDLSTWDGFLTILYLCIYFELSSALVLWDYAGNERGFEASIKNRTRACSLMYWIFSNHQFVLPSGVISGLEALQAIFCSFLAHHARLLIHYKRLAAEARVNGIIKSMTWKDVAKAVSDCVQGGPAWSMFLIDNTPHTRGTFAWHGPEYVISRRPDPVEYDFPFLHGYVFGDIQVAAGFGLNVPQAVMDALSSPLGKQLSTGGDHWDDENENTGARKRSKT
ncbi:hypothetical protein H0H87_011481 [Tephrocybe sp. NHM501043]|nr:hypothetical protein H0H87_011481 [Tephrocybe sp. NHM501043]